MPLSGMTGDRRASRIDDPGGPSWPPPTFDRNVVI
jgi:hypothetical protein